MLALAAMIRCRPLPPLPSPHHSHQPSVCRVFSWRNVLSSACAAPASLCQTSQFQVFLSCRNRPDRLCSINRHGWMLRLGISESSFPRSLSICPHSPKHERPICSKIGGGDVSIATYPSRVLPFLIEIGLAVLQKYFHYKTEQINLLHM